MLKMMPPPIAATPEETNAKAYWRAHAGKLMIIRRDDAKEPAVADFFELDSVGTHPTGLLVTGIFCNNRRSHMMASSVREANEAEIAWRNRARVKDLA